MAKEPAGVRRKLVEFDQETWQASTCSGAIDEDVPGTRRRGVHDLLQHGRPTDLQAAFKRARGRGSPREATGQRAVRALAASSQAGGGAKKQRRCRPAAGKAERHPATVAPRRTGSFGAVDGVTVPVMMTCPPMTKCRPRRSTIRWRHCGSRHNPMSGGGVGSNQHQSGEDERKPSKASNMEYIPSVVPAAFDRSEVSFLGSWYGRLQTGRCADLWIGTEPPTRRFDQRINPLI
jgi:hypothetical protein